MLLRNVSCTRVLFAAVLMATLIAPAVHAATSYTWNGSNGAAWETTTNWTPNGTPGAASGDSVTINGATGPTINVTPANTLASISISNAGRITMATGVTLTVTATTLDQGNLRAGSAGSTYVIPSGGTFSSVNALANGTNQIECQVTNQGSITVSSGVLEFYRSVTNTGTVTAVAANTRATVIGNNSPVFQNTGSGLIVGNFSVDTNATLRVDNNLTLNGTLTFDGNSGNNMDGSGSLTVVGDLNVQSGGVDWSVPTVTIPAGSNFTFARGTNQDGSINMISNAVIVCAGTLNMTSTNRINIASGSSVTCSGSVSLNDLNAVFGIDGNGTFALTSTAVLTSTNTGGAVNQINAVFDNAGTVNVTSGKLEIERGTNTGALNANGGTISFINQTYVNDAPGTLSGTILIDTNGKLTINNSVNLTGTLSLNGNSGNALQGTGSLTITGALNILTSVSTWSLPSVTVNAGSTWSFGQGTNQNGILPLTSSASIVCNGSLSMAVGTRLTINGGSTVTCSGAVNIDQINNINGIGTFGLTSTGTLTSTAGVGTNNITSVFNNAGTVISQTGTLNVGSSFSQSAGAVQLSGGNLSGTIVLNGGTLSGSGTITGNVTNGGTIAPGSSPGSITITGNYTQTAGGKMMMEIGGSLPADFDSMTISGSATLDGTFEVTLINSYVPPPGQQFDSMVFASRTGTFSTYTNNGGNLSLSVDNTAVRQVSTSLNPAPTISSLVPSTIDAGSGDSAIVVIGTNFISGTVVKLNGQDRPTLIISATELLVLLPAADVATAGTANITAFNGTPGGGTSAAAVLTIGSSGGGGTALTDTDGDGFSDSIEIAAGTSASNALETPVNNQPAPDPLPLPDVKLSIKLNFSKAGSDAIGLAGTLILSEGFDISGKTFLVDVGGVAKSFTLDAKGSSKNGNDSAGVKSKGTAARTGKFAVKLTKGSFAATLAGVGLNDADVTKDVNVPLTVIIDGKIYQKTQAQTYKAKAGKGGATKDKK